jgi:very-short-patch-repair endonuclease
MRQAVERAQDLRRFDAKAIRAAARSRAGTRELGTLLDLMDPDHDNARSHLERLFLAVVRRSRLPRPEVNVEVLGRQRDFVWRRERLVVEVDGYAYHSSREGMRRDRRRDRELTARGWRPVRFTFEEVAFDPAQVSAEVASLLSR